MPFHWDIKEHIAQARYFLRWLLVLTPVSVAIGWAVALFVWTLNWVTQYRFAHPWILFLLPLAGVAIGSMYHFFGRSVEGGNNLIMEQIHEPGGGVPSRMAPLVLIGTVMTHLFGGSAGREGTAIQMGGGISATFGRWFGISEGDTRILLTAGVAAGFGAVFGAPLAGAVFAMEVLAMGQMNYAALVPALIAAIIADQSCAWWGIREVHYSIATVAGMDIIHSVPYLSWSIVAKVALASVFFGLASVMFAEVQHGLHSVFRFIVPWPMLRPALGGLIIIALVYMLGTRSYIGLGVTSPNPHDVTIVSCFRAGGATDLSWFWKILFTTVTLSSGFKGGEVTPLFFVGAALGNTLAHLLGAPVDLFAGLGLLAVFAGATNTPLACTIMGIEMFGAGHLIYIAIACYLAYLFSGHSGIYLSQRVATRKATAMNLPPDASLRTIRQLTPSMGNAFAPLLSYLTPGSGDEIVSEGDPVMPHHHKIVQREIGQVRIYLAANARQPEHSLRRRIFQKPVYQIVIDAAKHDGILNASAHHTTYGFSGNGKVQSNMSDMPNPALNLCVELIGDRDALETFCRKHGTLLRGKVVVYKHMEHWDIEHHEIATHQAAPEELDGDIIESERRDLEGGSSDAK